MMELHKIAVVGSDENSGDESAFNSLVSIWISFSPSSYVPTGAFGQLWGSHNLNCGHDGVNN